MDTIERLDYHNRNRVHSDFEIVDLQHFFNTKDKAHITRNYRLNFWMILYITEGVGAHFIDFQRYEYQKGEILVLQKNQVHHFEIGRDVQGYLLLFNEPHFYSSPGGYSQFLNEFFNEFIRTPLVLINNEKGTVNRTLVELIFGEYGKDNPDDLLITSLIQSFLVSVKSYSKVDKALFQSSQFKTYSRFRELLEENFTAIRHVDVYAELLKVSKKKINSATRDIVGLSAKEVIIERIVTEIKRLLSLGELRKYEISDYLGFDEPSNMSKFFKRYTGQSPSEFKDSLK
ncbi:MAG: helix-turn-helix transcriptional regulator [Spirochaetales bacterium]|nr:helix-turn-helix transcriptional regulator [Spirochaetales bacterium]